MRLLLLLSAGLGLACTLQDPGQPPVQPGFQPQQVEGPWRTVRLGATKPAVVEEGGAYHCFMTAIRRLVSGDLNITYFHRSGGKCVEEFYIGEETGVPGRYTFQYLGRNSLTFVAVGNDFVIMDLENHGDDGSLVVAELHGRDLSVSAPGQEAYREHLASRGIELEHTVDLTELQRCDSPGPRSPL